MNDNRVYNLKGLNNRLEALEPGKQYCIVLVYANKDTGDTLTTDINIKWLKAFSDLNNPENDLQRIRIYDNAKCIISFSYSILDKMQEYNGNYNQDLRRLARPNPNAEKKQARTQILLPPTIKQQLKRKANLHGLSMNRAINELIEAYINQEARQ